MYSDWSPDSSLRIERECPGVVVLATSREGMAIEGEQLIALPPLEVGESSEDLQRLANTDAVYLFVDRARRVKADFVSPRREHRTLQHPGAEIPTGFTTGCLAASRLGQWELTLWLGVRAMYPWRWTNSLLQAPRASPDVRAHSPTAVLT